MSSSVTKKTTQRIVAIDLLRGVALLGILLMNMSSFAIPDAGYSNPAAYGGDEWWNRAVFSILHIIADQKMMAIFSMLFGASVLLITQKMEEKGESAFRMHYLRNFWLLIIGLLHSLVWEGDVLSVYALCAFFLYWLRRLPAQVQFWLGLIIFLIPSLLNVALYEIWEPQMTDDDWAYAEALWEPPAAEIEADLAYYRGDSEAYNDYYGSTSVVEPETAVLLFDGASGLEFFLRAFGMMLVGMAFYSWGILTAKRENSFYQRMVWIGLVLGLPLIIFGLVLANWYEDDAVFSILIRPIPNNLATPLVASAYIGLVMLWSRTTWLAGLQQRLIAVGRTALSNYIGQTLLSTFIFYGYIGLGFYGYLDRLGMLGVILLIWAFQLWASPLWMKWFRYGPLEWLWRSLSHMKWQNMLKDRPAKIEPA